jgi:nitroreductase/NAD-dependent dihydropyrimidine dehydrogenase PreA subunit
MISKEEPLIEISDDCTGCKRCVEICPRYLFEIINKKSVITNSELCYDCGHCIAICPEKAITHRRIIYSSIDEDFPTYLSEITHDQATQIIRQRRSIRLFRKNPLSEKQIAQLIDFGRYSPTGHNDRAVNFTIVNSREEVDIIWNEVISFFKKSIKKIENPFWMLLANLTGKKAIYEKAKKSAHRLRSHIEFWEKGVDKTFHGAPALVILHTDKKTTTPVEDCNIAAYSITLGAPSLGLGATYIGYLVKSWNNSKTIKKLIGLPENHELYACLAVGKPKHSFKRFVSRPEPKVTHWKANK